MFFLTMFFFAVMLVTGSVVFTMIRDFNEIYYEIKNGDGFCISMVIGTLYFFGFSTYYFGLCINLWEAIARGSELIGVII